MLAGRATYRSHKRCLKRFFSFLYAALTLTMLSIFVIDWTRSWQNYSSSAAGSRQLRSIQVNSNNTEAMPALTENHSDAWVAEKKPTMRPEIVLKHKSTLTSRTRCQQHYFLLVPSPDCPSNKEFVPGWRRVENFRDVLSHWFFVTSLCQKLFTCYSTNISPRRHKQLTTQRKDQLFSLCC